MLMSNTKLLYRNRQQFMRAACQWSHQLRIIDTAAYVPQCNKCAPLRLQARSRLGGGGDGARYANNVCIMQLRYKSSGKDKKETPVVNLNIETSATQEASADLTSSPSSVTKSFEVKTSKGILSITTTIEDSKINEIVFEKTELSPVAKLNEPAFNVLPSASLGGIAPPASAPLPTVDTEKKEAAPPTPPPVAPKRPRFDYRVSLERNFITPARAISDFMLTAADLEKMPKIKRRSPYEQEPPMTVYWRRDVEAKALEVWGSRENLLRERLKRELERKQYQQSKSCPLSDPSIIMLSCLHRCLYSEAPSAGLSPGNRLTHKRRAR